MRDDYDLSSLADVIQVARDTGVRALVSHLVYQYGECVMEESLQMLDKARAEGLAIWADSGMYVDWAFRTLLFVIRYRRGRWLEKRVV